MPTVTRRFASLAAAVALAAACGPTNQAETAASPVMGMSRSSETLKGETGLSYDRRADDGTVVAKLVAPAPAVWDALVAAMAARNVNPTILNRAIGRVGDTSLVLMRRWNGHQLSRYLGCGNTLTGARADEERVRAVFLAQLSRMAGDTLALAVHLSGGATPVNSGNSGMPSSCTSTGQAEKELIDDVVRRSGAAGAIRQ